MYFPMWTYDAARAIHFYEAILATLTIIVWHFYSVIFNPETYPMSWAWITGYLTEHEMELEHGLELEKIKAAEKGKRVEFREAAAVGGGRVYPLDRGKGGKGFSLRRLYGMVQSLNETMKNWKGE
jgi:hypothetical protein